MPYPHASALHSTDSNFKLSTLNFFSGSAPGVCVCVFCVLCFVFCVLCVRACVCVCVCARACVWAGTGFVLHLHLCRQFGTKKLISDGLRTNLLTTLYVLMGEGY